MRFGGVCGTGILVTVVCSVLLAQGTGTPSSSPEDRLQRAQKLYEAHEYADAAHLFEEVVADPAVENAPWLADGLYNLACYEALAGYKVKALASLASSIDRGYSHSAEEIMKDGDLTSLHDEPAFAELIEVLKRKKARWNSEALTSDYVPELSEDERIAGLSKFWSEARFNFPFFDRTPGIDWDRLYLEYLPKVRAAASTADYYRVMMRFAAALQDGHTNVYPPEAIADDFYSRPGLRTALIGNAVVVTTILDPTLESQNVVPGLKVIEIDGRPSRQYAEQEVAPYVSSSTPQDRVVRTYTYSLLAGPSNRPVRLLLEDERGKSFEATLPRIGSHSNTKLITPPPAEFKLLAGNIAYLEINEFENDQGPKLLVQHFTEAEQARGLVIDVRNNGGGSSDYGYQVLSMLTDKPFSDARWRTIDYRATFRAWGAMPGWFESGSRNIPPSKERLLTKPVLVLTSARTYSAAEDFVVAFDAMHRGQIVGQPTGGSTGQPLMFKLPGGGSARICTRDDSYPDGKTFEGKGIVPQIVVEPSVADIRTGRDVVLEAASRTLMELSAAHGDNR